MTANEMVDLAEILYDRVASNSAPGYEDSEWSAIFNRAQNEFVNSRYGKSNKTQDSFEETEKRRKDLAELVRATTISSASPSQSGVLPNGTLYDLPSDVMYIIHETCVTDAYDCKTGKNTKIIDVRPITHDQFNATKDNPFKKPSTDRIWRLDFSSISVGGDKRHELVTDGTYSITYYNVRYVKSPRDIVIDRTDTTLQVDSELNPNVHIELVDVAVRIAAGITNPQEYQIKLNEQTLQE